MSAHGGGSAFPQVESQQVGSQGEYHTDVYSTGGMSLRDYFAAKAMQGYVIGVMAGGLIDAHMKAAKAVCQTSDEYTAAKAYDLADAMLEARKS
jgi:hypothetical protein